MPRMRHRDTGAEADFTDREVKTYQRVGWELVDQPEGVLPSPIDTSAAGSRRRSPIEDMPPPPPVVTDSED